ncbi:MAG: pseudouridine synthase [Pseudoxanthomonas sp.]
MLSKLGICSRTQAATWVLAGRVQVDARTVSDPEFPVVRGVNRIQVDGVEVGQDRIRWLMLNKPRGLVTTAKDEQGRDTVYRCFDGSGLGWIAPLGRLDKASEGLLLFSNDPEWAARITDPRTGPCKTYHVQVDRVADEALLQALQSGVVVEGERLAAASAAMLRHGEKNAWLEIVLEEGRNRQIRRLLAAFDINVLRLIRTAIGNLAMGDLAKGQWRDLSEAEAAGLATTR